MSHLSPFEPSGHAAVPGVTNVDRVAMPMHEPPSGPPKRRHRLGELAFPLQPLRLLRHRRRLRAVPRGNGSLVVCIPGYLTPHASMEPLRWFLERRGYKAVHWGLGTNQGQAISLAEAFLPTLEELVSEHGRAALVGWSLGGVIAREAARNRPDLVSGVVCYGAPIIGGPKYTSIRGNLSDQVVDRIEASGERRDRENPVEVPVTSIYSKRDGVVHWRASYDRFTPGANHVEVRSSHIGLGVDPDVWVAVAEALARR